MPYSAPSPRRAKAVQNLAPRAANRTAQRSLTGPGEELIPLDLVVNFYRGVPACDWRGCGFSRGARRPRAVVPGAPAVGAARTTGRSAE
jgi:hypothetical protein